MFNVPRATRAALTKREKKSRLASLVQNQNGNNYGFLGRMNITGIDLSAG